jgi:hypothetical protein
MVRRRGPENDEIGKGKMLAEERNHSATLKGRRGERQGVDGGLQRIHSASAVIGAGVVVTRNVPAFRMVIGNPAC